MQKNRDTYGGILPWSRHTIRVLLNRVWSRILNRALAQAGPSFNVDFTTRILGGARVAIGSGFHATRGLKLVVAQPDGGSVLVRIGNGVCLNEYVTIAAHDPVAIGDNVLIGSRVYIGNVSHGRYNGEEQALPSQRPNERPVCGSGPMVIGANVWIGEGVIIPRGVTIGDGAIIGAGSVVVDDVPPGTIAVGNPARAVKEFDPVAGVWRRRGGR
jgi:lipopolysaccharide O-acetyltransferase